MRPASDASAEKRTAMASRLRRRSNDGNEHAVRQRPRLPLVVQLGTRSELVRESVNRRGGASALSACDVGMADSLERILGRPAPAVVYGAGEKEHLMLRGTVQIDGRWVHVKDAEESSRPHGGRPVGRPAGRRRRAGRRVGGAACSTGPRGPHRVARCSLRLDRGRRRRDGRRRRRAIVSRPSRAVYPSSPA